MAEVSGESLTLVDEFMREDGGIALPDAVATYHKAGWWHIHATDPRDPNVHAKLDAVIARLDAAQAPRRRDRDIRYG